MESFLMNKSVRQTHVSPLLLFTLSAAVLLGNSAVRAQGGATQRIQVNDPRPLSAVIDELRSSFGVAISYEELLRVSPADAKDITATIPADRRKGDQKYYIPRGGAFTFSYASPRDNSPATIEQILRGLVGQFNRVSLDAQFKLSRTGDTFCVVPVTRKASNGVVEAIGSVLDTVISIPDGKRTAMDQLAQISLALREAGHVNFGLGLVPFKALGYTLDGGVKGETARQALVRLLDGSPFKLDWVLLCGANDGGCNLSLRPVLKPTR